jgi:hypothetical protein
MMRGRNIILFKPNVCWRRYFLLFLGKRIWSSSLLSQNVARGTALIVMHTIALSASSLLLGPSGGLSKWILTVEHLTSEINKNVAGYEFIGSGASGKSVIFSRLSLSWGWNDSLKQSSVHHGEPAEDHLKLSKERRRTVEDWKIIILPSRFPVVNRRIFLNNIEH